jgi:hypothetical protein
LTENGGLTCLKNDVRASGGDPRIFNKKVQFAGP